MAEDEDIAMDDLPAYDTPEIPDQEEAEYDGETVTLYDPFRIDDDEKKFAVYVRNPDSGNVNKLKFGSADMEIERDDAENLKSFRERFSCGEVGQDEKHTATFWSCVFWRKDMSVSDILNENNMTQAEIVERLREASEERMSASEIEQRLDEVAGGPWESIREMLRMASQEGVVQDIGTKRDGGDRVHEFAVGGRVFQIKEFTE